MTSSFSDESDDEAPHPQESSKLESNQSSPVNQSSTPSVTSSTPTVTFASTPSAPSSSTSSSINLNGYITDKEPKNSNLVKSPSATNDKDVPPSTTQQTSEISNSIEVNNIALSETGNSENGSKRSKSEADIAGEIPDKSDGKHKLSNGDKAKRKKKKKKPTDASSEVDPSKKSHKKVKKDKKSKDESDNSTEKKAKKEKKKKEKTAELPSNSVSQTALKVS